MARPFLFYLGKFLTSACVQDVVISPGSRNAPFIIHLANCANINIHSIVDERSAAYVALGMAIKTGKSTVFICSSGTALLNAAPAVAEAYYQQVPLLVFSADRPPELIDQG
ncbi:MAG: 2-succinyl-5-enolpyruvyl-6-hydroxy-3-cyclohexene-1-carboxylic-acid synthase, partial [Bacteroidales bacterium]|nr:2-succinyl-5-enolpyruvyl-6-hydroxy-3-cyclohexene-1-carboxylic-acid synthase [Bacteroidales bacterium]